MMNMIIFYVLLVAESEFDIRFSPSRLDFAVQEVESFHFYGKLKKYFEQEWTITMFDMFLMYFWAKNPKKTSELTYYTYFFICWRFSFLSKNFNDQNRN